MGSRNISPPWSSADALPASLHDLQLWFRHKVSSWTRLWWFWCWIRLYRHEIAPNWSPTKVELGVLSIRIILDWLDCPASQNSCEHQPTPWHTMTHHDQPKVSLCCFETAKWPRADWAKHLPSPALGQVEHCWKLLHDPCQNAWETLDWLSICPNKDIWRTTHHLKLNESNWLLATAGHCWPLLATAGHCWPLLATAGHCAICLFQWPCHTTPCRLSLCFLAASALPHQPFSALRSQQPVAHGIRLPGHRQFWDAKKTRSEMSCERFRDMAAPNWIIWDNHR